MIILLFKKWLNLKKTSDQNRKNLKKVDKFINFFLKMKFNIFCYTISFTQLFLNLKYNKKMEDFSILQ